MLTLFFFLGLSMNTLQVVPGKSLGDVQIGDSSEILKKKNFVADNSRVTPETTYFMRKDFLVRLVKDRVVQIWYEGDLKKLRVGDKSLPEKTDASSFRKFFKSCDPIVKGSGGEILYCENKGVEIVYSIDPVHGLGFSVLSP